MNTPTILALQQFWGKPQNRRILHENAIAGILLFFILIFIEPFEIEELGNVRYIYIIIITMTTFLTGCTIGFFTGNILKMPLEPSLPLHTVHRNTLIFILVYLPITAFFVTIAHEVMFRDTYAQIRLWHNGSIYWLPFLYRLYYVVSLGSLIHLGTFIRNRNWNLRYQLEKRNKNKGGQTQERNEKHLVSTGSHDTLPNTAQNDDVVPLSPEIEPMCQIKGYTATSILEVNPSRIIYAEVISNYVKVYYYESGKPTHKELRITLKEVIDKVSSYPYIMQCHRSFIVNLHCANTTTSTFDGVSLKMRDTRNRIPVSRTFLSKIKEGLTN